jgi:hypothetical protein
LLHPWQCDQQTKATKEVIDGVGLPEYITQQPAGLYVDLLSLPMESESPEKCFKAFVNAVFAKGYFFKDVNYKYLHNLLYEPEIIQQELKQRQKEQKIPRLLFAATLQKFDEKRKALYKKTNLTFPHLKDEEASTCYFFDVVTIPDPAFPNNVWKTLPTGLYVDEFIAFLWEHGVKYGVDIEKINTLLTASEPEDKEKTFKTPSKSTVTIARPRKAKPGEDAGYRKCEDKTDRRMSPKIVEGRAILTEQENHFPYVKEGEQLLIKIPPTPGVAGRKTDGTEVPALPVKDFDFKNLAGPGTRIESCDGKDCLVAAQAGFVMFNECNGVFVQDHIEHDGGANMKTTGDLKLLGDYHEKGDIEGVSLEGFSFQIDGQVIGAKVSSRGGEKGGN